MQDGKSNHGQPFFHWFLTRIKHRTRFSEGYRLFPLILSIQDQNRAFSWCSLYFLWRFLLWFAYNCTLTMRNHEHFCKAQFSYDRLRRDYDRSKIALWRIITSQNHPCAILHHSFSQTLVWVISSIDQIPIILCLSRFLFSPTDCYSFILFKSAKVFPEWKVCLG